MSSFQKKIAKEYKAYKWGKIKLENQCKIKQKNNEKFKPNNTQSFISEWYPTTNDNGLLLYHSVGSGKTITGLMLAQKFEEKDI